uniref:ribosomal protein S14 n=1 Tax=Carex giraldiana TaxID=2753270 RepID=UPI00279B2C97|nr:ribosomal protein S14 [Carex giraldiana]WIL06389.1 ribosomal protein S14 [Carex giraldiana]
MTINLYHAKKGVIWQKKFNSERTQAKEIGRKISFDSSVLKKEKQRSSLSKREIREIQRKLQSLPRNSALTRLHRRCLVTGRPRANYRDFGLSGHILRQKVHACLLPGATKSSL